MDKKIGKRLKCVSTKIKREIDNLDSVKNIENASGTNGFILAYIYKSKTDVYQKDIEREFGITRSTASNIISLMEKKGLVVRQKVEGDQRLNKLCITEKASEYCNALFNDLKEFDITLKQNIDDHDLDIFFKVLDQIEKNLDRKDW